MLYNEIVPKVNELKRENRRVVVILRKSSSQRYIPTGTYLLKFNYRNTRTRYEICSKLTIKISKRRRRRSGIFIVDFEHISHLVLMFLLLALMNFFLEGIQLIIRVFHEELWNIFSRSIKWPNKVNKIIFDSYVREIYFDMFCWLRKNAGGLFHVQNTFLLFLLSI